MLKKLAFLLIGFMIAGTLSAVPAAAVSGGFDTGAAYAGNTVLFDILKIIPASDRVLNKVSADAISAAGDDISTQYIVKYKTGKKFTSNAKKYKQNGDAVPLRKLKASAVSKQEYAVFSADRQGLEQLRNDADIYYIEIDQVFTAASDAEYFWQNTRVGAQYAHTNGADGTGIKVAVIDTGIDTSSADIQVAGGVSFVPGVTSYNDDHGHGTMVSSLIAARLNDIGVVGAAPNASLYAVKVLDSSANGFTSNIIEGINWAVSNKINVINMSLGGTAGGLALQQATKQAYDANIVLIAASGNEGMADGVSYPAKYNSVMAIGSIGRDDSVSVFSNRGPEVMAVAPGEAVVIMGRNNTLYSGSGTSFSCAIVSGAAAAIWSKNRSLTNEQVIMILKRTAVNLGDANLYGYGLIDMQAETDAAPAPELLTPVNDNDFLQDLYFDFGALRNQMWLY